MEKQRDFLFFCLVLSCSSSFLPWVSSSEGGLENVSPKRLFVFGDSYADTGNTEKLSGAWHQPYGVTFPGEPSGRFSDGLVLTDYVASFLGIKSPQPYSWRNDANETLLQHGMNFAYGGTGVFDTMAREPNMTTQIDYFQSLVEQNVYTKHDLSSSVALVSLAGNDYAAFALKNANQEEELPSFITSVIDQLVHDLKRIKGLGVGKIAVTALEPLGCLPQLTAVSSFKNCSSNYNTITRLHNHKLHRSLQELKKNESMTGSSSPSWSSTLVILDLHSAFVSALSMLRHQSGNLSENPLKPCCVGATEGYSCGNVGNKEVKNYVLCDHPETSFFWDNIHPSQNGWRTVYAFLRSSLHHLL